MANIERTPKAQAEHDRITAEVANDINEYWIGRLAAIDSEMEALDFERLSIENKLSGSDELAD